MIIEFLNTQRTKGELATALAVLREFKQLESQEEWLSVLFIAWDKLEQLEEYLDHLVNGAPLRQDTLDYINKLKEVAGIGRQKGVKTT